MFLICRSAVFSFGLFSLLVLELRWSGAKPSAGGCLHSSSFQQPCSSLALFVAHSVVGLGDCRLSWPEPRAAASNNFNVNFPFILCVKLLLVWRWPPALWGQVLKSDVRLSGRQCAEIDRGVGGEVKKGKVFTSSLLALLRASLGMKQAFTCVLRGREREQVHKTLHHSKTTAALLLFQYSELCEEQSYLGKGQQGHMLYVKWCCNICFNLLGEEILLYSTAAHSFCFGVITIMTICLYQPIMISYIIFYIIICISF